MYCCLFVYFAVRLFWDESRGCSVCLEVYLFALICFVFVGLLVLCFVLWLFVGVVCLVLGGFTCL